MTIWVLNHASCSVLMVRNRPTWTGPKQPRGMRILLAADATPNSQNTFGVLRLLTFPPSSSISIVHVLEPRSDSRAQVGSDMAFPNRAELLKMEKQIWKTREREGQMVLKGFQETLKQQENVTEKHTILAKGNPAEAILEEAKRIQADLIVVGSRGITRIKKLFLGSLSGKVVRHASCSVLVVRKPRQKPTNL